MNECVNLRPLVPPILQFHVDKKGRVNYAQTDMLIHCVNNQTNSILDVERYTFFIFWNKSKAAWSRMRPVHASLLCLRVIQMIDENKEQLRNLFRRYNVVDVQPAVTDKLPDDITTLQVRQAATSGNLQTVAVFSVLLSGLSVPPQLVIIILAVLLCLAGILFVTMNWHYRRV